tara:strand:+ start:951 stop:1139 length:189 start_codon:yes stop_codon:yes gene_type:complete
MGDKSNIMINDFFNWCVLILEIIGDITGMGYELANIVIFVIIQPGLILLFFILWQKEKRKNK